MANLTDYFPAAAGSNLLEEIQCVPDGRSITVGSGTYTLQNVTGTQALNLSYTEVTGSKVDYTPPSGTKYIKYEYLVHIDPVPNTYYGISHYRIYVDGSDVTEAMKTYAHQAYTTYGYANQMMTINYVFDLTASTTDAASGKFSGWTAAKEICVKARKYSNTYAVELNGNIWRDGGGATGNFLWNRPLLTIQALS